MATCTSDFDCDQCHLATKKKILSGKRCIAQCVGSDKRCSKLALDTIDCYDLCGQHLKHDKYHHRDWKCCRCRLLIEPGKSLGGRYGGVVCKNHATCNTCWFKPHSNYGARQYESYKYRHIPLCDKPRQGKATKCYGCHYEVEMFCSKTRPFESNLKSFIDKGREIFEIDDTDSD